MNIGGRFAGKLKRVGQCVEWHGASSAKGYGRFGRKGATMNYRRDMELGTNPHGRCDECGSRDLPAGCHECVETYIENSILLDLDRRKQIEFAIEYKNGKLTEGVCRQVIEQWANTAITWGSLIPHSFTDQMNRRLGYRATDEQRRTMLEKILFLGLQQLDEKATQ